jgi:hypothetical protein
MVPKGCPTTSVMSYHVSLRNNPEDRSSHILRGESLQSRKPFLTQSAKKFPYFMEPHVSLPSSSVLATCPCPGPGQLSPHPPNRHFRLCPCAHVLRYIPVVAFFITLQHLHASQHSCAICMITLLGKLNTTITTVSDVSNGLDRRLKFPAGASIFLLAGGTDTFWCPLAMLCLVCAGDTVGALWSC